MEGYDLAAIQKQVNELVERRLEKVNEMTKLEDEVSSLKEQIKEVKKEFDGIDALFREKLSILNQNKQ